MEMIYTLHGMERSKERMNYNRKTASRQMALAIERGKRSKDFNRRIEREYLSDRCLDGVYAVAYNGACYIIREFDNAVITVYALPSWWEKGGRYEGKEWIKKAKAYYRMNDMAVAAM